MKWKTTWLLLGFAMAVFAFIFFIERHSRPSYRAGDPPPRLFNFKAEDVTNVQMRITNQLILRVERPAPATAWSLNVPISYPAQSYAIEGLLQSLESLAPPTFIPQKEITAGNRTLADFGLDVPTVTLSIQYKGQRTELLFGTKTPIGDEVYFQLLDRPGIYLINADIYDRLPRSANDWRDVMLFSSVVFNRIDVRAPGRGYTLTNLLDRSYVLTRPTVARADRVKVEALLNKVRRATVTQFITDHPRVDLNAYGLEPPELELAFGQGTNDVMVVQFGRSPTNDPSSVYARRLAQTNVVLTSREVVEALQTSYSDLRDLHMVSIPPGGVDSIEVIGSENFLVRRTVEGNWTFGDSNSSPADPAVIREWIDNMAKLEGVIEKDVVTDFKTPYNLSPPARQYIVRALATNGSAGASNRIVGAVDLGARQESKVFARRPEEATVYNLDVKEVSRLPYAAWQIRDRQVWNFTTNQIGRVTVRHRGQSKTIQRNPNGSWSFAAGSEGIISNSAPIEEIMFRLGELRASAWVAQGEDNKAFYGFKDTGDQFVFELRAGDKPGKTLVLEFGDPSSSSPRAPTSLPYAMAVADGQTAIFEFPPALFFELIRDLVSPMFPPGR
jgi:hypothetical protein